MSQHYVPRWTLEGSRHVRPVCLSVCLSLYLVVSVYRESLARRQYIRHYVSDETLETKVSVRL